MQVRQQVPLAPLTTFRIGGAAEFFIEATSREELAEALSYAKAQRRSFFVLGGGSNVLMPDEMRKGVVIYARMNQIHAEETMDEVIIYAEAGARWDTVVDFALERGLFGIENLAGIPGTAGGAAVQNIGAYGTDLSHTLLFAEGIHAVTGETWRLEKAELELGYRSSIFKAQRNLVITRVALTLPKKGTSHLAYSDLQRAKTEGVSLTTPREIATAIRAIRAQKFPLPEEGGTAGSFFKNPVLPLSEAMALASRFPGLPVFPQEHDMAKISLAWLLDHALHLKGFQKGSVRLFERQPIVIVAAQGASAHEVRIFANEIAKRVRDETGVRIEPEVELVSV